VSDLIIIIIIINHHHRYHRDATIKAVTGATAGTADRG